MNTANKLTMLRVVLVPIFLIILYWRFPGSNYVAMAIFVIASLTDFVDGYIARSRNQVTDFGKFLDPLADKLLVIAAMLWFVAQSIIPAWVVFIVIIREFSVTGLRLIAVDNGRVIAADNLAKLKTATTMVCLIVMFFPIPMWLVTIFIVLIVVTTLLSGIEYFVKNRDVLRMPK